MIDKKMVGNKKMSVSEKMNSNKVAPRLLGMMFVIVALLSLISGTLLASLGVPVTGPPDDVNELMANISGDSGLTKVIIAIMLIEAVGIVFLAVLLYSTLTSQNKLIARWAMGLWIIEAVSLALKGTFVFFLLIVSQEYVNAGSPDASLFQTLGILFAQSTQFAYSVLMVCYTIGGLMFYSLFLRSKYIPKVISIFGIAAVSVGIVGTFMEILGFDVPIIMFITILPFELAIGIWLMIKGIKTSSSEPDTYKN